MIILFHALRGPQPFDDAFITYRYARNLVEGHGFVYNLGEQVLGTTTPLFTLILAGLGYLFNANNFLSFSFAIAIAADIVNTLLVFRLSRHFMQGRLLAHLVAACFLLQPLRLIVSGGGMETSLFLTLLLLMYEFFIIRRRMVLTGIFAGLSIWMRPDAVLAIIPVLLYALWINWRHALRIGLSAAVVFLPWLVYSSFYFGSPVPHSILAKRAFYATDYQIFTWYFLFVFLGTGMVGIISKTSLILPGFLASLFFAVTGLSASLRRLDASIVVMIYPILYYAVMFQQKAPMFFIWYYIPLIPGFLLLFWKAIHHLVDKMPAYSQKFLYISSALVMVLVPTIYVYLFPEWTIIRDAERSFQGASRSIQLEITDQAVVFAPDIGVIGWELKNAYILDSVGLVSPQMLEFNASQNDYRRMDSSAVSHFRPDYIIAHSQLMDELSKDPAFRVDYERIWTEVNGKTSVDVYSIK